MQGNTLKLSLGYSHDVNFEVPEGVTVTAAKPTEITVEGIDQQLVGQVAANIREWRKPEPYKGKGIKYKDEYIFRKEGYGKLLPTRVAPGCPCTAPTRTSASS